MSAHTPGPFRQGSDHLQSPELPTEIYAANGYLVGRCNAGNSHGKLGLSEHRAAIENARRVVACWNACNGIPTEVLEANAAGGLPYSVADQIDARVERKEMLAALHFRDDKTNG